KILKNRSPFLTYFCFLTVQRLGSTSPFARLVIPDGRYWVERQALHRIQTGRDLMKSGSDTASATGMVVFGGVDYATYPGVDEDRVLAVNRRLHGEGLYFKPLAFAAREAKAVGPFYWDSDNRKAEIWRGRDASEDRLKSRLKSPASLPRILHLATSSFIDRKSGSSERPLTLAGVALAGANDGLYNESSPTGEDGILYALEALELNLAGTELVAFSACDTGRGEVDYSEGVYGLVRAFRIAGARHVLMSLWELNDSLAYSFMMDFYAKWFEAPDRHPAEVLREIQLAWIRSEDSKAARRSNPQYWAPYVLIEGR
ncbi:MAG: CHAT domain-containing protein, partial [Candidatus Thiosymbion ectosymbiont of Robbea hypermnestra]|nr:CHAT domain-containing protein [Candidatus Thiosymbion ectosymbiont of Robbea hypermnestra]